MNVWVWSAGAGFAIGATVFALVLIPIVSWQYRVYGRVSPSRIVGAACISVYIAAMVAYTQLPLPSTRSLSWCEAHGVSSPQLIPFASFETMWLRAGEIGWLPMLSSTLGLQVMLNVVLFLPWGIVVRGFLQQRIWTAVWSGAGLSLLIELTQATGVWGMYPCAYRLGDVDDLITNTLGAFLGACIAPLFTFWIPKRSALIATRLRPRPVTGGRRALAMLMTYGTVWGVSTAVSACVEAGWRFTAGKIDVSVWAWWEWALHAIACVVCIGIPALKGHGSIGLYVVWLRPVWRRAPESRSGPLWLRLARASVLGVPLLLSGMPGTTLWTPLFFLLAVISLIMIPFTHHHRSLSGWITRADIEDSRVSGP